MANDHKNLIIEEVGKMIARHFGEGAPYICHWKWLSLCDFVGAVFAVGIGTYSLAKHTETLTNLIWDDLRFTIFVFILWFAAAAGFAGISFKSFRKGSYFRHLIMGAFVPGALLSIVRYSWF